MVSRKKPAGNKSVRRKIAKEEEPILLRRVYNIDKLFTKKDIKNIVDRIVNDSRI